MALERNMAQLEAYKRQQSDEQATLKEKMGKIKHKIAIISGKGGVGKSTVTVNLATAFAIQGKRVGVLDSDIHGPSVPRLLGLEGKQVETVLSGVIPVDGPLGMKVMSIDFFLPEQAPTIWRGPLKMRAIRQFLTDTVWGDLDFLFIDLPPGTGDVQLSISQTLDLQGGVIVTMPQQVSLDDALRGINMFQELKIPIFGVVENIAKKAALNIKQQYSFRMLAVFAKHLVSAYNFRRI